MQVVQSTQQKLQDFLQSKGEAELSERSNLQLRIACQILHDSMVHISAIFEQLISHQSTSSTYRDVLLPEDCPDVKYDDLPHFFANYYNVMLSEMLSWNKIEESKEEGE